MEKEGKMKGKGWFFEKGGGRTTFEIEMPEVKEGEKIFGRIFNEVFQKEIRMKEMVSELWIVKQLKRIFRRKETNNQNSDQKEIPEVINYPEAEIKGHFRNGILFFQKKYKGINQNYNIEYELKRDPVQDNKFIGVFKIWGCPAIDFNCMHCLGEGPVEIVFE